MGRLNRLCASTGAAVVVSSTWRRGYETLDELASDLASVGLRAAVVGRTPHFAGQTIRMPEANSVVVRGTNRGDEIAWWLWNYGPFESFVIVDDDRDMGQLRHALVQTSFEVGLTDEDVDRCIALLGGSVEPGWGRDGPAVVEVEGGVTVPAGSHLKSPRRSAVTPPSPSTPGREPEGVP